MRANERRILEKMRTSYAQAINSKAWANWKVQLKTASDYLAGRQAPKMDSTDAEKQYFVINQVKGMITRLAAMQAEGKYRSIVESPGGKIDPMAVAYKDILGALQERNYFEAQMYDMSLDTMQSGMSGLRGSIDIIDDPDLPPITIERMIPGSFMISPFANKPYDRLLGSPYIQSQGPESKS
jgi:hypothetical protein